MDSVEVNPDDLMATAILHDGLATSLLEANAPRTGGASHQPTSAATRMITSAVGTMAKVFASRLESNAASLVQVATEFTNNEGRSSAILAQVQSRTPR
ncbi:hypothetical protein MCHIJ_47740 [Mycolicibacterium chitae]|nr:hypothetical protein MCHIJ_47740 [Mycolicibacterium chitae]